MQDLLDELAQPFAPSAISWKPGKTTNEGDKCMALAYADLRAYQERLDAICGTDWSVEYAPWGDGKIVARLTILVHNRLGHFREVTRAATGEADAQDERNGIAGSVAEAMAFKRAAAMFGMGRYLYDLPSVWVAFDSKTKRITKDGMVELDRRYLDWYTRKMAALTKEQGAQTMRVAA